jgi:hypothetical protein
MRDNRSPFVLLNNAAEVGEGPIFDLAGAFISHAQVTHNGADNFSGTCEYVVEWTQYFTPNGPWEVLCSGIINGPEQVSVTEFDNIPGFMRYVRGRITTYDGSNSVTLKLYVE